MPSYEIRGVIKKVEEGESKKKVVTRDTENHLYDVFEINPKRSPHSEAAKHLGVGEDEVELPTHVEEGMKKWME